MLSPLFGLVSFPTSLWLSVFSWKQTTTRSRLPPRESNSPFLQVNQADAVNCPRNSVHGFFQAMPHPATSQTGLKRKGAIHKHHHHPPSFLRDAKSYERGLAGLPEHAVLPFLLNATESSWELMIWMETMVTISAPPQPAAFSADFLSLPAVITIQYSLASWHASHPSAPGDSSKRIRYVLNWFWYQVMVVKKSTHTQTVHTTDLSCKWRKYCPSEKTLFTEEWDLSMLHLP